MTKLEYKKLQMQCRAQARDMMQRANTIPYLYGGRNLESLWDVMNAKNIGLPFILRTVYRLGVADGLDAVDTVRDQEDTAE